MAEIEKRSASSAELGSVNVIELVNANKRTYIFIAILSVVGSAVISLLMPEKFKSTATLHPTVPQQSLGQSLTNWDLSSNIHLLSYGGKIDVERYLQIVNSTTVRDRVIETCDLYEHYEIDPDEPEAQSMVYFEYESNVSANITKYESIDIEVLDEDPQTAVEIANHVTLFSDSLEREIRRSRSESSLNTALKEYDRLALEIAHYEDSIAILRSKGVVDFYAQVPSLTREYADAIGKGYYDRSDRIKADLDTIGKYGNDYIRLMKRMDKVRSIQDIVHNRIALFRLDMLSDLPSMFVIDEPKAADKKSYPIRWLIVVLTTLSTLFLLTLLLLISENFKSKEV